MLVMGLVPLGFKEAEKMLKGIRNGYPRAMRDAINRGLQEGKNAAVEAITHRYVMSDSKVKQGIKVNKASLNDLKGNLDIKGEMQRIDQFHPRISYIRGSRGPRRQVVRVTIIRGQTKVVRGAFRIPDKRIMERRQSSRFPIFPVSTIGIAHMAGHHRVAPVIQKAINSTINTQLKHNVEQVLQQQKKINARIRTLAKKNITPREVR
jgi:hypothetical protein